MRRMMAISLFLIVSISSGAVFAADKKRLIITDLGEQRPKKI
ncbi:hypothetical protein [uncultured Desulfobacter sp.]|nr:hypothetical protein [uncultured Desulfobacter sp.]